MAVTVVLALAGFLLLWGATSPVTTSDELSAQNITFPSAAELEEEGRTDLVDYADEQVTTGEQAVGNIAFVAAMVAFGAAVVMLVLVVAGIVHLRRTTA